jgi:hypothetical protein
MINFLNRFGVKRTRRTLYAILTVLIAAVVVPGLGGMIGDRLIKKYPAVDCALETKAVGVARLALTYRSASGVADDLTGDWLRLRERSVILRRQCKLQAANGQAAVVEDERVRRSVAAYRVQRKL